MRTFQVTTAVLKAASILSILAGGTALSPLCAMETERGPWRMSFNEKGAEMKLVNGARDVSLAGTLSLVSGKPGWKVLEPRDAVRDRISIAGPDGTVHGYVAFRSAGDRLEWTVYHRAGNDFFPGRLVFKGRLETRRGDTFACRTIPSPAEGILSFADGAGDSPYNDSVFSRPDDLAVRFTSAATSITTIGGGAYGVTLEADVDDAALATVAVEADGRYFRDRWAPGYHPIDRRRCPRAPTGWMSWNVYFDKAGAKENLAEARIGAKYLKPFGLDIWQIESWQEGSEWLPVSTFHNLDLSVCKAQFPEGMKKLADDIRALGFRPGLWMALYGTGDAKYYEAHRSWFLHDAKGKPIPCWNGRYMLDTTNPEVLAHLRYLTHTATHEWGYDLLKLDGMANTQRLFERPGLRAGAADPAAEKWFEGSVRAFREGMGEDKIMTCMGDYTGSEAPFIDSVRMGADVVECWSSGMKRHFFGIERESDACLSPVKWRNVMHQVECTLANVFVNNIIFYTDPDTLLVGDSLELNEAHVMATVAALPGQVLFSGDKLAELRPNRMRIIQQCLPVADIHPQNLYPHASTSLVPIWNLSVTRPFGTWRVVAVFNFKDAPQNFELPFGSLGLDGGKAHTVFEFWRQKWMGTLSGGISLEIPMRTVRLLAIWEAADHPQFVGDDRHVTQGAVEVNGVKWDAGAKTYTLDVKAIGGFPFTYFVRVPEGFSFKGASASKGGRAEAKMREDGLLAVTVSAPATQDVAVILTF
jgi:hypothetical protein